MYCKNCGKKIKEEETFCKNCGTKKEINLNITSNQITENDTFSIIISIISIIMFWFPIISIPLAIIAIINGKKYYKKAGTKSNSVAIGIVSLIISTLYMLVIILLFTSILSYFDNKDNYKDYKIENKYDKYNEKIELDIVGNKWLATDSSILYLENNNKYNWYLNNKEYSKNYHSGTYDIYTGYDAINYIATNLGEYNISKEEQLELFESGAYDINNYILIILSCNYSNIDGIETNTTGVIPYYGFYYQDLKKIMLVNMKSSNKAEFNKIEETNNYVNEIL